MPAPPATASRRHGAARQDKRQVRSRQAAPPRNPAFEEYYRAQRIVPEEAWEDFLGCLRTPGPVVVRVNRTKPHWEALHASFEADRRWTPLPWAPGCWRCAAKDYNDALNRQVGALNKAYALRIQEAASLVPPLLMDPGPADLVFDMCSAPGSKTLECLELMRARRPDDAAPEDSGVMVANDADAERAFEILPMITRKARHAGTVVTLANAAKFPPLLHGEGEQQQLLFDRVICDVPCSGDGTLRKNQHNWAAWSVKDALGYHVKQLRILCRGLHLLKPGGFLAYSTCSLNPVENEAVVAAALRRFAGDVSLVPRAAAELEAQGLRTSPGLPEWGIPDPSSPSEIRLFRSWVEVPPELRRPKGSLCETMFPRGATREEGAAAAAEPVEGSLAAGCVRLDPHKIDGSGFFVAVFQKARHHVFAGDAAGPGPALAPAPPPGPPGRIAWRARNEANHYELVDGTLEMVKDIAAFYGLRSVPEPLLAEFNVKGRLTQLNLINEPLKRFLQCRLDCKASPLLISVGVPLFKPLPDGFMTEVELPSRWRPALEGTALLGPLMEKRVLRLDPDVLDGLLAQRLIPMERLHALGSSGAVDGLASCGGLLGGVVVGSRDGSFWAPCMVTGLGLELFASAEELGSPAPELLPPQGCGVMLEGEGYVGLEKPSGLRTEDALDELREKHPEAELVSRLDRETSGCLLVPTNASCAAVLTRQFAEHTVRKTYLALVSGEPPESGVVDAPLALAESGGGSRYRAFVDAEKGKASETRYRTLWAGGGVALVCANPISGRTHQIRCHLAHIGFPLVGDPKYNGQPPPAWCKRLPLHCLRVQAEDERGAAIDLRAPLSGDFSSMLEPGALEALEALAWD